MRTLIMVVMALTISASAYAQNNRSAVSVAGADTNPCTVASPCRTINHAIQQTNPEGEVIVLTSGGYDMFTVDRAISVIAPPGIYAGITVSYTTMFPVYGINVNAPATADVVLSGLTLTDANTSNIAVYAMSGRSLVVDRFEMSNFTLNGCVRAGIDTLVEDSVFHRCSEGVMIWNLSGAARAVVNRSAFYESGGNAVTTNTLGRGCVRNSVSHRSVNYGFGGTLNIENTMAIGSHNEGFISGTGDVMRLSNCLSYDDQSGVYDAFGTIETFGNNKLDGYTSGLVVVSQR